jgi:hypothetical protein
MTFFTGMPGGCGGCTCPATEAELDEKKIEKAVLDAAKKPCCGGEEDDCCTEEEAK